MSQERSVRVSLSEKLHERAIEVSARYKKAEGELLEVLQEADTHRIYLDQGYSSLFEYVVRGLGLSESVAYNLITVTRKAREVPELQTQIAKGAITLSNARKIVPVLTAANQGEWLMKASKLSQRQLEKEVVRIRPKESTPERASYVTESRVKLELGLAEAEMLKLRRVQDLISQARARSVSLEEVLIELTSQYLKRHDPVERAKRVIVKKGVSQTQVQSSSEPVSLQASGEPASLQAAGEPVLLQVLHSTHPLKVGPITRGPDSGRKTTAMRMPSLAPSAPRRLPLPAAVKHQVHLRDQSRCTFLNAKGERCRQRRFVHLHHRVMVSRGGGDTPENLVTLCSVHHRWVHSREAHFRSRPS